MQPFAAVRIHIGNAAHRPDRGRPPTRYRCWLVPGSLWWTLAAPSIRSFWLKQNPYWKCCASPRQGAPPYAISMSTLTSLRAHHGAVLLCRGAATQAPPLIRGRGGDRRTLNPKRVDCGWLGVGIRATQARAPGSGRQGVSPGAHTQRATTR